MSQKKASAQHADLWEILSEMDCLANDLDGFIDILAFILDAAADEAHDAVESDDGDMARCFAARFEAMAKMLFAVHGSIQGLSKQLTAYVDTSLDLVKQSRLAQIPSFG